MGAMASQITSIMIVYSGVTGLREGNSLVTSEVPAQRASNAEMFPLDEVIMYDIQRGGHLIRNMTFNLDFASCLCPVSGMYSQLSEHRLSNSLV